jgi:hypothetical protein
MSALTGKVGFASPIVQRKSLRRKTLGVELIATAALAVSLIIALTAVSIGVARAHALGAAAHARAANRFGLNSIGALTFFDGA